MPIEKSNSSPIPRWYSRACIFVIVTSLSCNHLPYTLRLWKCSVQANARKFLQSSGGLSYLAASVRKFRSGPTATVGNPFFRHVPPLDWLDAAFDNQKKKAKSAVPSSPPVILANVSSSALTSAGGLRKGSSSSDRRRRRHDGSGTASETEQQQGEVQARLRDALWLAPREQASADADASFTRPRVWKVRAASFFGGDHLVVFLLW